MRFIADYDTAVEPFAWTYTGDPLSIDMRGTDARQDQVLLGDANRVVRSMPTSATGRNLCPSSRSPGSTRRKLMPLS